MVTQSVDVVLSKPGLWLVAGCNGFFIEIEPDGTCYQLNPTDFSRDGELRRGGWRHGAVFAGPLARAAAKQENT